RLRRSGARARLSPARARIGARAGRGAPILRRLRLHGRRPRVRHPDRVTRVPLLSGTRLVVVDADKNAVLLAPPPPAEPIADVAAAVRDALRFPLAGEPLEALVPHGGQTTVVVEPPALPVPSSPSDPRRIAIAATMEELARSSIPLDRQTLF